jgi:hypothetical protein
MRRSTARVLLGLPPAGACARLSARGAPPQAKAGITEDIVARMTEHSTVLSKGRKKRAMPATLATPEDVGGLALLGCHPLHKTAKARAGPPAPRARSLHAAACARRVPGRAGARWPAARVCGVELMCSVLALGRHSACGERVLKVQLGPRGWGVLESRCA